MREFLQNVITKQNEEITYMKYKLLFWAGLLFHFSCKEWI
jgi:hypothetical protein